MPTGPFSIGDSGRTVDQNRQHIGKQLTLSNRFELIHKPGKLPALNAAIAAIYDQDFEILGTNASADDVTVADVGWKMETDGADGDEVILVPHLDAGQTPWTMVKWGTDNQVEWECMFVTGTSIANTIVWGGLKLTNTEVVATDNDQVFVRYEDDVNGGKFQVVYSIGGVDYTVDSLIAVAASTKYHVEIKINDERKASVYINGAFICETRQLTNAVDLIPYVGVAADGAAAAKHITYLGQAISREQP